MEDNMHTKEVDFELMEKIKKATEKKAMIDEAKKEEEVENRRYDVPAKHYKDKVMDDGVKTNEKEIPKEKLNIIEKREKEEEIKRKAEAAKAAYQELAKKVTEEKESRDVRLEESYLNVEDHKPNPKGSLLKDIAYIIIVVAVLVGACSLLMSNVMLSLCLVVGSILFGAICLGLAEVIRLLQLIYDLMYYEKFGTKRK